MTAQVVLPQQREAFRRAWRVVGLGLLGPAAVVGAAAVAPGLLPQLVVLLGIVVLIAGLLCLLVWLLLPLAVQQERVSMVDGRLHATTLRGPRTLELDRLRRLGGRSLAGKGGTAEYLSLRADRRVVLSWNSGGKGSPPDELRPELAALARSRPDVEVSERARVLLALPDAPGHGRRVVLALRTIGWLALLMLVVTPAFFVPAVYLGEALLPELRR